MIYLHVSECSYCRRWYRQFAHALNKEQAVYQEANLERQPPVVGPQDSIICRFNEYCMGRVRPCYLSLIRNQSNAIVSYPDAGSAHYYDDKALQIECFQDSQLRCPASAWVTSISETQQFIDQKELRFPLVRKLKKGSASRNVSLVSTMREIEYPCLLQEYIGGNDGDFRIVCIGRRVMGYKRMNRSGDFRASGSGRRVGIGLIPSDLALAVDHFCAANGFQSMAFDFVRNDDEKWVVLEMSYTFVWEPLRDYCQTHFDCEAGDHVDGEVVAPDFVIRDTLSRRRKAGYPT